MSEVTSSIEEPIVRVGQRLVKYQQPTSTQPRRMLWLTILAGMMVLAMGEGTANEFNETASEPPVELTTTESPPPREAVTDLFKAPLAAFKVQVPLSPQLAEGEEGELVGLPLGKAENNTDTTTVPPFSNLWFNAGQSLGSAANSLTGWLNSRLVPQTTSTTTRPPEVIVRVENQKVKKQPLLSITGKKKPQGNRISPELDDADEEDEEDDEDVDDEEEYEDGDEEREDDNDSNSNRYEGDNEDDDVSDGDDDEEDEEPIKKRRGYKKKPNQKKRVTNHRRGYDYEEEEDDQDYYDDEDYDYDFPEKHSGRQQQQSFLNRFRQLAQLPYSSSNKQQSDKPGFRPVRIVQNGQVLQLVEDRPNKQQVKRRRPAANSQNTFQLIPIRNNQLSNAGQKQNKKKGNKPDPVNELVIPIPQTSLNGKKRPNQYITIPWSQLGITNPQQESSQNSQQAPFIVNIPQNAMQQNSNRRKRPTPKPAQAVSTPQRKRLRRPLKNRPQNGQMVSILTDQNIRDIFRVPEIPPSRTPQEEGRPIILGGKRKRPVQSDDDTTARPVAVEQPEPEMEDDEEESHDENEPYIMVGEDGPGNEALARSAVPRRFLHIGGMKPYVDVLNKGRFYLKSGRKMQMDFGERPETKITSINPAVADKSSTRSLDITTESSSETKANAPPTILVLASEDTSTTGNPLSQ